MDRTSPHGFSIVEPELWRETVIDVVDPTTGRLLARSSTPSASSMLFGKGDIRIGRVDVDLDERTVKVVIVRLELERREP